MTSSKTIQIQGHRGGYKPDNVLATFQKSLDNGLEAIELDVIESMTDLIIGMAHKGQDTCCGPWR